MNQSKPYVYGQVCYSYIQMSGKASYKAPSMYQINGPQVSGGGDRYDNYSNQGGKYQYKHEDASCC